MNETLKTIANRRSCRCYNEKKVPLEIVKEILIAGTKAPSALNKQSASIICLQEESVVENLRKRLTDFKGKDPLYGAKTVVIVYADKNSRFAVQDASCILENMFLAATSLGIASCWINCLHDYFATEEGNQFKKEILNLDDEKITVGTCILGYSVEEIPEKEKKSDYIKII